MKLAGLAPISLGKVTTTRYISSARNLQCHVARQRIGESVGNPADLHASGFNEALALQCRERAKRHVGGIRGNNCDYLDRERMVNNA